MNRLYRQFVLMIIRTSQGDTAAARQHLNQLSRIHDALGTPWRHPLPESEAFYGLLSLLEGNPTRLVTWSHQPPGPGKIEPPLRLNSENQLRLLAQLVHGQQDSELLGVVRNTAEQNDNQHILLQTYCLEDIYLFSKGRWPGNLVCWPDNVPRFPRHFLRCHVEARLI